MHERVTANCPDYWMSGEFIGMTLVQMIYDILVSSKNNVKKFFLLTSKNDVCINHT